MSDSREEKLNEIMDFLLSLRNFVRSDMYNTFKVSEGNGYGHVKSAVSDLVVRRHAEGVQPIAVFFLKGDLVRAAALDLDSHDGSMDWDTMTAWALPIVMRLRELDLKPMCFRSGGGAGMHIWVLWKEPQSAARVRKVLAAVLAEFGARTGTGGVIERTVEIFPKADVLAPGGVGSCIALPLARKSVVLGENLEIIPKDEFQKPDLAAMCSKPIAEVSILLRDEAPRKATDTPRRAHPDIIMDGDEQEARGALMVVPSDDYDTWIKVGLGLKNAFGNAGYTAWEEWSARSSKFGGAELTREVWDSLKPDGTLTLGTVFFLAQQRGWNGPSDPQIRQMNREYGVLAQGKRTQIIIKNPGPESMEVVEFLSKETLKDRLAGSFARAEGVSKEPLADHWLRHAKAARYTRLEFDPEKPPGHNGTTWNVWSGFAFTPEPGDWSLLNRHIHENIARGDDELHAWLVNWLALGVQQPGLVIGTAPTLKGLPGTGKGVLAHAYGRLWGPHYASITHDAHVKGRFNSHLFGRRFVFIDEGIFGGDRRDAGVLKTRITEPELMLEMKGVDAIKVKNRTIHMVASNEDSVVPADMGDRRWQVIEVSAARREDHAYFGAIEQQLRAGGFEAMLFDLVTRDISTGPDPRKTIKTPELFEQIIRAGSPGLRYVYELLDEGRLPQPSVRGNGPGRTTIGALHAEMMQRFPRGGFTSPSELGRFISRLFPTIKTVQSGTFTERTSGLVENHRSTRYTFPPLAIARRQFEAHMRQIIPWTRTIDDWDDDSDHETISDEIPF